jgi:hypothetical protein
MNAKAKAEAYSKFFDGSEAGLEFLKELNRLIDHNHEKAEEVPESARDHVQRAKGNREVLQHIRGVTTEIKKGRL